MREVNLLARAGQITMLLGRSGSGKTTLLKLARGFLRPAAGQVLAFGEPVEAHPDRGRLDSRIAYIPQHLGLVRSQTAAENAAVGGLAKAGFGSLVAPPRRDIDRARELLGRLGLADRADAGVARLSGGQRQRVAIARALMQGPRVLLADELVSQLDPATVDSTMSVIRSLAQAGLTVLMTTHELELLPRYADAIVVLRAGGVVLESPGATVDAATLAEALA